VLDAYRLLHPDSGVKWLEKQWFGYDHKAKHDMPSERRCWHA
jgi:hypothetical protein